MAKWNRRQFLSGLLATAGVEAAVVAEARVRPAVAPAALPATDPAPVAPAPHADAAPALTSAPAPDGTNHELRELLPEGLRFGRWEVVAVHDVKYGAVPVILATRTGERFQVDVLRRDRRPGAKQGVARTRLFALHLANVGRGVTPTREEHGLGILWLAAYLRTRERAVEGRGLLTLRDRLVRHPTGRFDALQGRAPSASPPPWGPILSQPSLPSRPGLAASSDLTPRPPLPGRRGGA